MTNASYVPNLVFKAKCLQTNMFRVQYYLLGTFDGPWLKVSDGRADNLTNSSFLFGISVWDISLNFLRKICCLVNLRNKQQWKMSLFSNSFRMVLVCLVEGLNFLFLLFCTSKIKISFWRLSLSFIADLGFLLFDVLVMQRCWG